jgi:hypothetical protein
MNRHLGRVRARDQVGGAEEVEELGASQPVSPGDDLLFHHADVYCGAADGCRAQLEEQKSQLQKSGSTAEGLRFLGTVWGHRSENCRGTESANVFWLAAETQILAVAKQDDPDLQKPRP